MTLAPATVFFDALGTLVGLEPPWPRLRASLSERFGVQVSEQQATGALLAEMSFYRANCHRAGDLESLAALRAQCTDVLAEQLGGEAQRIERSALGEAMLAAFVFVAYDDAHGALAALRARGCRLAVISNWDVSLHGVLEQAGLRPLLDGVFTSAQLGLAKPDPQIFRHALAATGADVDAALHVGDSLQEDVAGAQAAGIAAVLIERPPGALLGAVSGGVAPVAGVRTIASLAELAA